MNTFTHSKKGKKLILALVILVLFSFVYPKTVKAITWSDAAALPAKVFWLFENGLIRFLNNIFTNETHRYQAQTTLDSNGYEVTDITVVLTPDNIIKGKFLLFDANIFKELTHTSAQNYYDYEEGGSVFEGKQTLRETIAGWYYALRNFAIVALLSVLVYVGIRMVLSTVAQDKAKYKTMFKDWLVAICLLFTMHYFMIGILDVTSLICDAMGGGANSNMLADLARDITGGLSDKASEVNYTYVNPDKETVDLAGVYAKIVVFGGILAYTFIFAVKYLKREFTIIFLILLGPVSCITYPIDKISDGKAQAFNRWFSEFLYQVIIQPFHLLLYIVLIGTATDLANANVLYALVCFAVIMPAEKFVKEMFGFKDKLGSPLGAFAGGAIAGRVLSSMFGKGKGAGGPAGGKGPEGNNGTPQQPQRQLQPKSVDMSKLGMEEGANKEDSANKKPMPTADDEGLGIGGDEPESTTEIPDNYRADLNSDQIADGMDGATTQSESTSGEYSMDYSNYAQDPYNINTDEPQVNEQEMEAQEDGNLIDGQEVEGQEDGKPIDGQEVEGQEDGKPVDDTDKEPTAWDRIWAVHNQRAARKWGSTDRTERWKNRGAKVANFAGRTAKSVVRTGFRAAGAAAGAVTLGALGAMVGKGAAGAGAGAALGSKLGNSVGNVAIKGATGTVRGVKNTGGEYIRAIRGTQDKYDEQMALKKFKADKAQIDKATESFMKNNKGRMPSRAQLDKEMNDRFALSRYNLKDEQIDRAVGKYQNLRDKGGMSNETALNTIAYSAKISQDYDKKDYRNALMMNNAVTSISNNLHKNGVSKEVAFKRAQEIMKTSAEIKGVKDSIFSDM